jgi:hypothetical protein
VQELSRSDVRIPDPASVFEAGLYRIRNPFEALPGCEDLAKGQSTRLKKSRKCRKRDSFLNIMNF